MVQICVVGSQTTAGTKRLAETLTDWKSWNKMVPLLVETAVAHHRKLETKEM